MGVLHPPGSCILMGVAFSWRCITRLSVLFRHFSSAGLSILPRLVGAFPSFALQGDLSATSLFTPLPPYPSSVSREQRFPQAPGGQELWPVVE